MDYTSLIKEVDIPELVKALKSLANGIWKNCEYTWFGGEEKVFKDAAAAIEALQAEVEELKRVNMELFEDLPKYGEQIAHWASVEERLPDDSRDVIIFTASGIVGVGSFLRPNWYQWYSGGGLPVDVTHWMEKPEPPKEGNQ